MFKRTRLIIQLLFILVIFAFYVLDETKATLVTANIFIVVWGLDKAISWYLGEEFGVHEKLKIPADAHPIYRVMGLIFVLFVLAYGIKGLIERVAT